jgi:hypothetical protein
VRVRLGETARQDERAAAAELADQLVQPDPAVYLVFASPRYSADALTAELATQLRDAPVLGCTTAGEISVRGFRAGSAVGLSLPRDGMEVAHARVDRLDSATFADVRGAVKAALAKLKPGGAGRLYGLVFIDGLAEREETFIAAVAATAPQVRWVGGSAIGYDFNPAWIFEGGRAHLNAALVVLLRTDWPVHVIKSEHMVPTGKKVVVTETSATGRRVLELDGKPAVRRYGQLVGADATTMPREQRSTSPFACRVGGQSYVRSVIGVEDSALRFACAVAPGTVLELMQPGDLIGTTRQALESARHAVGGRISALVAFNCLGRYMEAEMRGVVEELGQVFAQVPVVGFNTYGEQCDGLHVNHTFTGLALGQAQQ